MATNVSVPHSTLPIYYGGSLVGALALPILLLAPFPGSRAARSGQVALVLTALAFLAVGLTKMYVNAASRGFLWNAEGLSLLAGAVPLGAVARPVRLPPLASRVAVGLLAAMLVGPGTYAIYELTWHPPGQQQYGAWLAIAGVPAGLLTAFALPRVRAGAPATGVD